MKYTKGDRVQLRDSAIAAIVSTYESTRGYAVVVDGEKTHLYRHEDQIHRSLNNDVHCRCGHEHAGMCVPGVTALNLIPSACAHGCSLSFWCRWQRRH
jgi:hypothetical protein